jgi:hypothetical protein
MIQAPIVEDIHKIRRENAAKLNFDISAIYQQFRELEKRSKLKMVSLPPKRLLRKAS